METAKIALQLIVGLGILNVWLLRFNKKTSYRGAEASNMKAEFKAYGLPEALVYLASFVKITLASMLLAGIWFKSLVNPAAIGMAAMMFGAIVMHFSLSKLCRL